MYVDVTLDDIILYALEHHVGAIFTLILLKVVCMFDYDKMDCYKIT